MMVTLLGLLPFFLSSWTLVALVMPKQPMLREDTVQNMMSDSSYQTQFIGCSLLRVDSSKKDEQNHAAGKGVIEAIAKAMNLFPGDKELIKTCTGSLASLILFNRENGLKAGKLGCLNHTLHTYMQNMEDPTIMAMGGNIGAFFDFVDENRRIAAELGAIQAIIQNIKNHFHGQYSEWNYDLVKQSLYALSSGCWVNQDICVKEGFPELAVALMAEHGDETKIAEETLQVTKALIAKSDKYRDRLVELGITDSMVHVMQVNPHDRGALDLTCENFAYLVGPQYMINDFGGLGASAVLRSFSNSSQSKALHSGALKEIMKVVMSGQEMHHYEHSSFNFDVDSAYNVRKHCFFALAHLGLYNPDAQAVMSAAGLPANVEAGLHKPNLDMEERLAGCFLMEELDTSANRSRLEERQMPCHVLKMFKQHHHHHHHHRHSNSPSRLSF